MSYVAVADLPTVLVADCGVNACYAADTERGPILVLSPHQSPAAAASAAAQALGGDVRWDVVQALVAPHFPGWRFEDLITDPAAPHAHGFPGWLSDRFEKDLSRSHWIGWGFVLVMLIALAAAVSTGWYHFLT